MRKNNRMLKIIVLLFCLAYFQGAVPAQDDVPWGAVLIAMSNNGRHLAVKYGEYDGEEKNSGVWLYDLDAPLSPPHYLGEANFYGTAMTFSPDSQRVTVARGSGLEIFNTRDNSQLLEILNSSLVIPANFGMLSHSLDSKHIMSFSYRWRHDDGVMFIWEIDTGMLVSSTPAPRSSQWVKHPWLSPDWRHFLDWSPAWRVRIHEFDIDQGLGPHLVTISDEDERGAFFSPDSSLFALVKPAPGSEIKVFRTDTWELTYIQVLGEHACSGADVTLAFGHIKPWLIYWCTWDARLLVWDLETGELLLRAKGTGGFKYITPDDGVLVAAKHGYLPEDSEITVWDANNSFEMMTYPGKNPQLHPNGELMATIGPDRRVWIWNIKSGQLQVILPVPRQ